jgi:thiamine-phosphate pyrophosphorylase
MTNAQKPRLYLFTPPLGNPQAFAVGLETALAADDVAAVLLRLDPADERTLINRAKAVAPIVQRRDVALLLDGHPEIAARAGADGAHLTGIEALQAARGLKPDRIIGAGGLRSRHDAMLAGEADADYVMFGEPDGRGTHPPFDALCDRVAWWAEVFEIPCVGYAGGLDDVGPLARAKADFVALGDWLWTSELAPDAVIKAAAARLAEAAATSMPRLKS